MLKKLFITVVLLVCGFIGVGLSLPSTFKITRTTFINAHQVRVLDYIMKLDKWEQWWPWDRAQKGDRLIVGEQISNEGATVSWHGRPASGSITLTNLSVFSITYDLQFDANTQKDSGAFAFRATTQGTEVSWTIDGHFEQPVIGGYLALIADSMHGGMLDWGLSNIKDLAENDKSERVLMYTDEHGKEVIEKIK